MEKGGIGRRRLSLSSGRRFGSFGGTIARRYQPWPKSPRQGVELLPRGCVSGPRSRVSSSGKAAAPLPPPVSTQPGTRSAVLNDGQEGPWRRPLKQYHAPGAPLLPRQLLPFPSPRPRRIRMSPQQGDADTRNVGGTRRGREQKREGEKEGLELGSAPEREGRERGGAQEQRRRSREFITVNISRGRQEGWGWGPRRLHSPAASDPGSSEVGAASRPTRDRRSTESEPRAAPHAGLRAVGTGASEAHLPGSPHLPPGSSVSEEPRHYGAAFHRLPPRSSFFWDSLAPPRRRGRGRQRSRRGGGRGGRSQEKVACPSPGGGGGGGLGKTMPRLRKGERQERARRVGRSGASRLRAGSRRSEAPASASPRPDAAGDRAGLRQPPPSPLPPPGVPSKSLELREDAALSGINTRARRIPREPLQVAD
ncbi:serine/arginine repetitive matrix protein 1-like [Phyllostomus hastatus]|uniref:serine/arginine repetitive matrix protein 1-like n=1 Tax=Phyllostomus hastatus TaxID=9423 RepID=UPI001E6846B1|nr:serine/arginine repetitive matrix protein 1-like [Phyllostomus hastatus]